jgi:hypothetical protein
MTKNETASSHHEFDAFWLRRVYPDAEAAFTFCQAPIDSIKDHATVVLDANVLLLPYRLGATSLGEIKILYEKLAKQDRIFIPAQAGREFVKNRADRLRNVIRDLGNQASQINVVADNHIGFLEGDEHYKEVVNLSTQIKSAKSNILMEISKISDNLRTGIGSDPVSRVYQNIFRGRVVELPDDQKDELLQEMKWRYDHSIPPGYKDKQKADEGIGDFIIWKTLLKIATEKKVDMIFVTEDAKGDWWVQSEGVFQPRIELVEEYRRCSDNRTIHLLPLSSLLKLFGANLVAVDDAKQAEAARRRRLDEINQRAKVRIAAESAADASSANNLAELSRAEIAERIESLSKQVQALFQEKMRLDRVLRDSESLNSLSELEMTELFTKRDVLESRTHKISRLRTALERELKSRFIPSDD